MTEPKHGQFIHEPVEVTTVHSNLSQEIVQITVDRLKLVLQAHLKQMERRKEWIAPLGVLIALVIVFPTTEFRAFAGLKAETWQAIFIISTLIAFIWWLKTTVAAFRSPSVEDVIERIKRGT